MEKQLIFCVDDESTILKTLKSQLRSVFRDKYMFETVDSSEYALDLFRQSVERGEQIPLIIADYLMPSMKGDALLQRIHEISKDTKKILLTGQADMDAVTYAINHANLYRYISKPWSRDDLIITVKEALGAYDNSRLIEEKNLYLEKLNKELDEKVDIFHRFVPFEFLNTLNASDDDFFVQLNDNIETEIVSVFIDIRSFTSISNEISSQKVFEILGYFIETLGPIITAYGGFIDKFIGDCIMAIFLDPKKSVEASLALIDHLPVLNQILEKKIGISIKFGISLHSGLARMGTVGYSERMQTTVIGSVVNVAAKLENFNKVYGTTILLTDRIVQQVGKGTFPFSYVDELTIPGIKEPFKVWTLKAP